MLIQTADNHWMVNLMAKRSSHSNGLGILLCAQRHAY
jgi:hypothetical protein